MTYAIQHVDLNASNVKGVLGANFDYRLEHSAEGSDGRLHERAHHYLRSASKLAVTSRDLQTIATMMSGNGDTPSAELTAAYMYGALADEGSPGYASGGTHRRFAATDGFAALNRIAWSASNPKVECGLDAYFLSADGTTIEVAESNVALPTQLSAVVPYTLTALTAGGSDVLKGTQSLTFEINHGSENNVAETCYNGGLPHPQQMAHAGAHGPISVLGTIEHQNLSLNPSDGDIVATFTALAAGGFLGADTVVVTLNGTIDPKLSAGGNQGSPLSRSVVSRGFYDGTNKPLTITP